MAFKSSPSLRAYRNLQRTKAQFCAGKVNKSAVKAQASNYSKAATAAGKPKTEINATISRVLKSGCKMSSSIAGRKRRTTSTRKRRTTRK